MKKLYQNTKCMKTDEIKSKYLKYNEIEKEYPDIALESRVNHLKLTQSNQKKNILVTYNGQIVLQEAYDKGIEILSYHEMKELYPQVVKKLNIDDKEATYIYVQRDAFKYESVVFSLFSSVIEPEAKIQERFIFIIDQGNKITIQEEQLPVPSEADIFHSLSVDVFILEESECSFVRLQANTENVYEISEHNFFMQNNAKASMVDILLGGKTMYQKINAFLEKEGSEFILDGIGLAYKEQIFETNILIHNIEKHTSGKALYHNILFDESKLSCDGLIKIEKGADFTNSYLEDHCLLLSEDARADSIPCLEIEANEVKASHGATIGNINADELFYAQTRGFTEKEAEELIITGFSKPIVDKINDQLLQQRVMTYISHKIS